MAAPLDRRRRIPRMMRADRTAIRQRCRTHSYPDAVIRSRQKPQAMPDATKAPALMFEVRRMTRQELSSWRAKRRARRRLLRKTARNAFFSVSAVSVTATRSLAGSSVRVPVTEQERELSESVAAGKSAANAQKGYTKQLTRAGAEATKPLRSKAAAAIKERWKNVKGRWARSSGSQRSRTKRLIRLKPQRVKITAVGRVAEPFKAIGQAKSDAGKALSRAFSPFTAVARRVKSAISVIAFLLLLLPVLAFAVAPVLLVPVLGAAGNQTPKGSSGDAIEGLPDWFTDDMVIAALECQEEYGHPAGATLAQIIIESGWQPSDLATVEHNLFGMTWWSGYADCPEVSGYVDYRNSAGIMRWISFKSNVDCIVFRSRVFLQSSGWTNNPYIQEGIEKRNSNIFVQGLVDWCDEGYPAALIIIMNSNNLQQFDNMTVSEYRQLRAAQTAAQAPGYSEPIGPIIVSDGQLTNLQEAVISATYYTPSTGAGYCAAWVTDVFSNAGIGLFYGNACDMYWAYCNSSNYADLEPGMIIAVYSEPYSDAAVLYGHVGVYIGNGTVAHCVSGTVCFDSLEYWVNVFGVTTTPRWGWLGNVDLSG